MSTELTMPKLGLTMKTGKVARWLVAEGSAVRQGDEIFEVETDKITNKVESPADGVLVSILVQQGETVAVGTVLGVLGEPGEAPAAAPAAAAETAAPEEGTAAAAPAAPAAAAPQQPAGFVLATPRARNLARFLEMDLAFVQGTGKNGCIREADVQARQEKLAAVAITPLARVLAAQAGLDILTLTGTGERGKIVREDVERVLNPEAFAQESAAAADTPAAPAALGTAPRAVDMQSGGTSSFVRSLSTTLDMAACLACAGDMKRLGALYKDVSAQVGPELVLACLVARALSRHPSLNATVDNGLLYERADVDLALACPGSGESVVLPGADKAGLLALARARKQAQAGASTCTLTSFLGTRVESAATGIAQGQAANISVGCVKNVPCVENGAVSVCACAECVVSYDVRLVDDAAACAFVNTLTAFLQDPVQSLF